MEASPSGLMVWYDPTREGVELYELEPPDESGVEDFSEGDGLMSLWGVLKSSKHKFPAGELPF